MFPCPQAGGPAPTSHRHSCRRHDQPSSVETEDADVSGMSGKRGMDDCGSDVGGWLDGRSCETAAVAEWIESEQRKGTKGKGEIVMASATNKLEPKVVSPAEWLSA